MKARRVFDELAGARSGGGHDPESRFLKTSPARLYLSIREGFPLIAGSFGKPRRLPYLTRMFSISFPAICCSCNGTDSVIMSRGSSPALFTFL